jgi:tripartite-type tricarboxylate transporter receptor subunit TctC
MEHVYRSTPDGYTLMFASEDATTLLPFEKKTMPYKMPDAFTYISRVTNGAYMIACNPDRPYKTIQEFIAYGKANPGKLKFAISGIGTAGDVAALLLEQSAGIKMNHVSYRGGAQSLTDTIAGITDAVTQSYSSIAGHAQAGRVRLMVWTGPTRNSHAPDVPTMTDLGYPDATLTNWLGVLGPANLPQDIQNTLQKAISDCLHEPALKEAYLKVDFDPTPVVGEDFRQQILKELAYWKTFVEKNNLYID